MSWLYVARIPAVALLMVAEWIAFIAPNNPGPMGANFKLVIAKYGQAPAYAITRVSTWFPIFSLVSGAPSTLRGC